MKEWYPYREISFSRNQIKWLLTNIKTLREGIWPENPEETGYIDPQIRGRIKARAYFEIPASIAGELGLRLKECGLDGEIAEAYCQADDVEKLCERFNMDADEIEIRARKAIKYISDTKGRKFWIEREPYQACRRFIGKPDLTRIQIQERAKRKRNARR